MRVWLLVAVLALAGCASEDAGNETAPMETTSATEPSTTEPTTAPPTESTPTQPTPTESTPTAEPNDNNPPVASLSVVLGNGTGNVTLLIDASDPDDDLLSWVLDLNGTMYEGGEVPAELEVAPGPGNHTATLTVTDGHLEDVVSVNFTVGGGGGYEGTGATTSSGNPASSGTAGALACAGFQSGQNNLDCAWFEFGEGLGGLPYTTVTDGAATDGEFWDSCSPLGTATPVDDILQGTVPEDVTCVVLWEFGTGTATYTFTIG